MVFDIALASTDGEPQTRRKIMTSVIQTGPCALVDISERFSRISAQYLILSFYETKKGQIGGQEVCFSLRNVYGSCLKYLD